VQIKNGRPQGRYRDAEGNQHARMFDTPEQAEDYWRAGEQLVRDGLHPGTGHRMTVEAYWLDQYRHRFGYLQPGSRKLMESIFCVHIIPRFGPLAFHQITFEMVADWKDEMVGAGKAPRYVREILRFFYAMLTSAAHLDMFDIALVGRMKGEIRKPKPKTKGLAVNPDKIPTPEQVGEWFEKMPDYCGLAVMIAAQTGMRAGEVLGLSMERIGIRKATVDRQLKDSRERGDYMGPTKSEASDRPVPLPAPLMDLLAEHLVRYPPITRTMDCYDRNNQHWQEEVSLIFGTRHREILRCSNLSHLSGRAIEHRYRFHDLRHFFASYMLANGMELPDLSRALGHERLSITQDTYIHCVPKKEEDPQHAVMSRLFGSR